jgi:hypothetical protein
MDTRLQRNLAEADKAQLREVLVWLKNGITWQGKSCRRGEVQKFGNRSSRTNDIVDVPWDKFM